MILPLVLRVATFSELQRELSVKGELSIQTVGVRTRKLG